MKLIFLSFFSIAIFMSSCTKDQANSSFPPPPIPHILNLSANEWIKEGIYFCTFTNVLEYHDVSQMKVFLKHDGLETEIPDAGIQYLGGIFKAWVRGNDLVLAYDPRDINKGLPSSSMYIKVVFQE
jgi:hypothetical protein